MSLQTLLLQSNAFIGTPTPAINASMSLLTTIDISDNLLTGNVPSILFEFKYISIIAAAKNCFKGTLPTSLCRPTALVSLILDGLSSGQSCIDRIPYTAAYWARRMVEGEIPACLLTNQPFLTLLHASGNFLSGKFLETDITNVTSKLVKLVVSHNRLSGSISESIQRRPLLQLDVSFNLITGTVEHFGADRYVSGEYQIDDNKTEYSTTIINLKENRLSGNLPSSFHYASDIDVLGGNLFSCDPETTPQNDPAAEEYICGSDDLDAALMAWGVLVIVVIIAYASLLGYTLLMGRGKQRWWATLCREGICTIRSHAQIIVEWYTASNVILQQAVDERLSSRVSNPSDGVMTDFDRDLGQNTLQFLDHLKTHRNSCVFISAIIAFIYGPLCIIIKSNLLPAAYGTYLKQMSWVYSALFQGGYISAVVTLTTWCSLIVIYVASSFDLFKKEVVTEEGVAFVQSSNTAAAVPSGESSSILQRLLLSDVARFLFTLTFNCTIVLAVNLAYVYGMISDSTSYSMKIVLRLLLIMFNALWTNSSITMIYQVFPREMKRLGSHSAANVLLLLIPMFNTVFAPLISSALLDDSCFRRLLSGEDEITASYAYLKCTYSVFELFENGESSINCAKFEPTGIISTTFEASYNYSYSCSSSLMKVYLPVLMAGYLIKCCLVPMAYTILLLVGESNIPKSMLSKLPKIIFPSLDQVEENSSENYDDSVFIFDAIKVVAFMRNHLLVLLTFGFASPPLAISISVTAIAQTTFWQLLIGRYLQFSKNYEVSNVNKISFSGEVSFNDKSSSKATIVVNVVNMTPLHSSSIESQADIGIFDNIKDEDFHAKRVSQGMIWRSIRAVDSATARCCLAVMTWARLTLFSSLIFCGWIIIDISADAEGIEGSIWVFISIGAVYVLGNIGIYISGSTKKV